MKIELENKNIYELASNWYYYVGYLVARQQIHAVLPRNWSCYYATTTWQLNFHVLPSSWFLLLNNNLLHASPGLVTKQLINNLCRLATVLATKRPINSLYCLATVLVT